MKNRTQLASICLMSGWLLLFGGFPLLLLLFTSFLKQHPEKFFELSLSVESYAQLINPDYLLVFLRSTLLAGITTFVCLIVGYPFAWLTCRMPSRYRLLILIMIMIPFWTNSLIRTYAVRIIIGAKGIVNKLLLASGIIESPIRLMYTDTAVLLGLVYLMLPFMILPLYANIEKLDYRLVEASRDLGAGPYSTFRSVILPLTMPGIVAGCIMVFVPTMGLFYVASLLGGAKKLLIGNLIQHQFLVSHNWPLGSAMSTTLIGILVVMLLLYRVVLHQSDTAADRL
jgi:spermidine/putrescine transport system permease protein